MPPKKRIRCTDEEKRWLREYRAMNPSVKINPLRVEFERKFKRPIGQSTVSTVTGANGPSNTTSTVSGASGFMSQDLVGEGSDQGSAKMQAYQESLRHITQGMEDKTASQGAQPQYSTVMPEILGCGFSAGDIESIDSASFHVCHQQCSLDVFPTEPSASRAHNKGSEECLIPIASEYGDGERPEQACQPDGVQSSYAQASPSGQYESEEWMHDLLTGVAPSPVISPILHATDNFTKHGTSLRSPNGRLFLTEHFQNPSSHPVGTKRRPQSNPSSECKVTPDIFWSERPSKRRRAEKKFRNDTIDIAESLETLLSLRETSEKFLCSSSFDSVCQALRNILMFTTNEYRQKGEKSTTLFKTLDNALRNSHSIILHTAKTVSSQSLPSVYRFNQSKIASQQQRQNSVVYSCQAPSARIDLIARKRVAKACGLSNHKTASSEVPLTEVKQPVRENEAGAAEAEDSTTCFIGTVVILISFRLTIPSSSEIFKIAARGTVCQLREMLESRAEFWNVCDENGISPIHYAAKALNIENCAYLLEHINDVDAIEPTFMHQSGDKYQIKSDYMVSMFAFPLFIFSDEIQENREKIAAWYTMLLKKGADPSLCQYISQDESHSTFAETLRSYSCETLKDVLNYGTPLISLNSRVIYGYFEDDTPLLLLASYFAEPTGVETFEKIMLLLERGADAKIVNDYGETCLHRILSYKIAGYFGNRWNLRINLCQPLCRRRTEDAEKVLVALVKAGANVYARTNWGESVSERAYCNGHTKLWMKVLKTCGYDPWDVLAKGGLNVGCRNYFTKLVEERESCLDVSSDTNSDEDGETPEYEGEDELDSERDKESLEGETEEEMNMDDGEESSEDENDINMDDNQEAESGEA